MRSRVRSLAGASALDALVTASPASYRTRLDQICHEVVAADAAEVDAHAEFPTRSIQALGEAGLLGAVSAVEVGGLGLGPRGASVIVERLAMECGSTAMVVCMHFSGTAVLEAHADESVRRAAAEGAHLSTLAFSESGSRSQFWVPTGDAVVDGETVVLSAHKSWVTSASHATAYVWSSRPYATDGLSTLWLVPADTDGLTVSGAFDGLGLRGNDSSPVVGRDVRVPLAARLGDDGAGLDVMLTTVLPLFNVLNAACSLGLMEAALRRTARHATNTAFAHAGTTIADLPTARSSIGRMRVGADGARGLLLDSLSALDDHRSDVLLRILECKALAGETATQVLDLAMRVCGGSAFRKEVGVERFFRDARAATVMGPTTDVLYDLVGRMACGRVPFVDGRDPFG